MLEKSMQITSYGVLNKKYELTKDWASNLCCGIELSWDYGAQALDISMPRFIQKC
jgi:hypothetical protein